MKIEEVLGIIYYNIKIYFKKRNNYNKIYFYILIIILYIILNKYGYKLHGKKKFPNLIYKSISKIKCLNNNLNDIKENKIYNNKTHIYIAMSVDNKFIYPTLVSIASALENNDKSKNILVYYLFLSYNFDINKIKIIESLKKDYEVLIYYYIIPHLFKYFRKWDQSTYGVYYKLLIPFLFPELKRIIYLDSDTLILEDIMEMFNLPFNDNYILGYPFHTPFTLDKYKIYSKNYINGGVLLINNEKIIKDKKEKELIEFTYEHSKDLVFLEQDSINYILYPKIGFLPLKYGIYLYGNITNYKINYKKYLRVKLNISEIKNAMNKPSIIHFCCCSPKLWNKNSKHNEGVDNICKRFQKLFYFYANKTNYYELIYKKYMS